MSFPLSEIPKRVYALLENPKKIPQEKIDSLAINLANVIKRRFSADPERFRLRFSNLGKPVRQLWFEYNYPSEQKFSGQTLFMFLYGDIIEELTLFFIQEAGYDVDNRQKEVKLGSIKGSIDGTINGNLIDVKSSSSFTFDKYYKHQLTDPSKDSFGYLMQGSGYTLGYYGVTFEENTNAFSFVAVNKENGAICVDTYNDMELLDANKTIKEVTKAFLKDTPPEELCYDTIKEDNGNEYLALNCVRCSHKDRCFGELRKFKYSNGIRYYTKVVKEPRVEEIND